MSVCLYVCLYICLSVCLHVSMIVILYVCLSLFVTVFLKSLSFSLPAFSSLLFLSTLLVSAVHPGCTSLLGRVYKLIFYISFLSIQYFTYKFFGYKSFLGIQVLCIQVFWYTNLLGVQGHTSLLCIQGIQAYYLFCSLKIPISHHPELQIQLKCCTFIVSEKPFLHNLINKVKLFTYTYVIQNLKINTLSQSSDNVN